MILYSRKFDIFMLWDTKKNVMEIGTDVTMKVTLGLAAALITRFGAVYVGTLK